MVYPQFKGVDYDFEVKCAKKRRVQEIFALHLWVEGWRKVTKTLATRGFKDNTIIYWSDQFFRKVTRGAVV